MTNTSTTPDWHAATQAVQEASTILVVTHIFPDGDAIGSLLGLGNALREMGKAVDLAVDGGNLDFLSFLPGADSILSKLEGDDRTWDLMISVDASDESRTGEAGEFGRAHSKKVINLDHHATNTMFGDIHVVDRVAASATQVIFDWLRTMNWNFSRDVALPLLTGLVTDTLGFRTSNTTADTLDVARHLMKAGATLAEITERTLDTRSYLTVNLWKHALQSVELHEGGVIVAQITQEDVKRAGLADIVDAGLVGFLIRVNEANIAAVFKEDADGKIGLSLRSKPGFDVAQVAFNLGGGGHKQASGATIEGSLDEVRKRVLPLLKQAAKQGKRVIA